MHLSKRICMQQKPTLSQLIWQDYKLKFCQVILLNLLNAFINVATIAFINHYFLTNVQNINHWQILIIFLLLIGLLLFSTFISQLALTKMGHAFVFELRAKLVKQILDTSLRQIDEIGSAKILASLSQDIQSITMAFVRLPELVQGVIICVGAGIYLASLSVPMFFIISGWLALTIWLSSLLVNRVYQHLENIRQIQDGIYQDYETVIDGRKELSLNLYRTKHLYYQSFIPKSQAYQQQIIKADTFHLSAVSFSNIMMFACIGLIFAVAGFIGLDMAIATTFGLTILFLQSPLLKAVGAYPVLQTANIALAKIHSLQLADYKKEFDNITTKQTWQRICFQDITYQYPNQNNAFSLNTINFELKKGEVIFLIGANGSGKSTLAKIITGLYKPTNGKILLDDSMVDVENNRHYRELFSAIYSDFYLFNQILGNNDEPNPELLEKWLNILALKEKLNITENKITNTELSTGQKKRIALLLSIVEGKEILLLDEWAADQDPMYRQYFYHEIIPLLQQIGKTLFIISHDDHYFDKADRLFEMRNGHLTELTGEQREKVSQNAIAHLQEN